MLNYQRVYRLDICFGPYLISIRQVQNEYGQEWPSWWGVLIHLSQGGAWSCSCYAPELISWCVPFPSWGQHFDHFDVAFFFLNHPFKWSQVRVYPIQLIVRHRFIPSSSNLQPSVWPWPTSKQICPKSAQGIDLETGQDPLAEIGGSKSSHGGSRWVLAIGFTAASGRKIYHGHGKLPILLCSPHCVGVWPCQPSVLYRPEYSEVVHGLGTQEVAIKVYKTATKSVNSSEDSFYHSLMPLISHSLSNILQTTVVRYQ